MKTKKILKTKKSLTSMDWIISLSLFLLFVVWFFLILKPRLYNEVTPVSSITQISKQVYDELKWEFDSKPIILQFSDDETEKRFIKVYIGDGNITDIKGFYNNPNNKSYKKVFWMPYVYSFVDEEYLFFTYFNGEKIDYRLNTINSIKYNEPIKGMNYFYNLNKTAVELKNNSLWDLTDLNYNESYVSNSFLSVEYYNNLINELSYKNKKIIKDYSLKINNVKISNSHLQESFDYNPVAVLNSLSSEEISIKNYLPRYSNEFFTKIYLKESSFSENEVIVEFKLKNFTSYGFKNFDEGRLNYNSNECYTSHSSKVYLNEEDLKTIISFETEAINTNITLCEEGSELNLKFEILIDNKKPILWQRVLVDDKNKEFPDYVSFIGVGETKKGISDYGLNKLFSTEEIFNSIQNDFDFVNMGLKLYYENKTIIGSLGDDFPEGYDVYSKQFIYPLLKPNGEIQNIVLVVNTW